MPMHDWTLVPAGIFHAFHHRWISAINDALNGGLLPNVADAFDNLPARWRSVLEPPLPQS